MHCKYRCLILLAVLSWLILWLLSILLDAIQFIPPNTLTTHFPYSCKEIIRNNILVIFLLSFKIDQKCHEDLKFLEHVNFQSQNQEGLYSYTTPPTSRSKSYFTAEHDCFASVSKQKGHLVFLKRYPAFTPNISFPLWNYVPNH